MNNQSILEQLNKVVYGHDKAKKTLITLIRRAKIRHYKKWVLNETTDLHPMHCLLIGDSGTGKTHLIESLRRIINFPYLYVDATKLNPTGGSGGITSSGLMNQIETLVADLLKTSDYFSRDGILDQMVIFVDEFDKLTNNFESTGKWNAHVQSNFLTLFDHKGEYSGISWVFAGTFQSCKKNNDLKQIGFFQQEPTIIESYLTDDDIIRAGLIPEIVGRLNSIVTLDVFTAEDYLHILNNRLIPTKIKALRELGISAEYPNSIWLETTALEATRSSQGVRYLERKLNDYYMDIEWSTPMLRF